jgi:carboxyl-terminal processing protease
MPKKLLRITIAVFIVLGIAVYAISGYALSGKDKNKKPDTYKQLETFSDALAIVESEYVEEVEPKKLIYGALKGLLASLDTYSQFLDPDEYNELKVDTTGEFGGLGIEITSKDGLLMVITPIVDTPAWKSGVKSQDRIVKIDKIITKNITLQEAVKKLRGKPGTEATITIWRESEQKLFDLVLKRDIIKIKDIRNAQILENNIAYVRITEFKEKTGENFGAALEKLRKEGMDSLILDLRNNPGGLLDSAVKVTEYFIEPDKIIVSTNGRKGKKTEFKSRSNKNYLDMPVLILINEGSASGSEIVAGALQDYKRAVIAGTKSFGKGSVQSIIPLSDGSAIRLTTNKYFTPLGRTINNEGVKPDIIIEPPNSEKAKNDKKETTEEIFNKIEQLEKESSEKQSEDIFDYKSDREIQVAINLLKGIKIYKTKPK